MKDKWIYDYFLHQLRLTCQAFEQHSTMLKEILDDDMRGQLEQARQYEINRMYNLCRLIKQVK